MGEHHDTEGKIAFAADAQDNLLKWTGIALETRKTQSGA